MEFQKMQNIKYYYNLWSNNPKKGIDYSKIYGFSYGPK